MTSTPTPRRTRSRCCTTPGTPTSATTQAPEEYTYQFDGTVGSLDHVLANARRSPRSPARTSGTSTRSSRWPTSTAATTTTRPTSTPRTRSAPATTTRCSWLRRARAAGRDDHDRRGRPEAGRRPGHQADRHRERRLRRRHRADGGTVTFSDGGTVLGTAPGLGRHRVAARCPRTTRSARGPSPSPYSGARLRGLDEQRDLRRGQGDPDHGRRRAAVRDPQEDHAAPAAASRSRLPARWSPARSWSARPARSSGSSSSPAVDATVVLAAVQEEGRADGHRGVPRQRPRRRGGHPAGHPHRAELSAEPRQTKGGPGAPGPPFAALLPGRGADPGCSPEVRRASGFIACESRTQTGPVLPWTSRQQSPP